jgi:hypothetical protein
VIKSYKRGDTPRQIININPLPADSSPAGMSCITMAVAVAIGIIAAGVALALVTGAIW